MKSKLYPIVGVIVALSMILSACTTATPTAAPTAEPTTASAKVEPTSADQPTVQATESVETTPEASTSTRTKVVGAFIQEPDNVTPWFTQMASAFSIAQFTMLGLAEWNGKGELIPDLAVEIPTTENGGLSEDGLTVTWKLQKGLLWSDGEPLTSADVKFTYEMTMNDANQSQWQNGYDKIESVETPDDLTVVIKFKEMYTPWYTLFTQGPQVAGAILPKHVLENSKNVSKEEYAHIPSVVTGPYIITKWVAGDHIEMVPNEKFHGQTPNIKEVYIRFVADSQAALAGLQAGDLDFFTDFDETFLPTLEKLQPDIKIFTSPSPYFEHYLFNLASTKEQNGDPKSVSDVDGPCEFRDIRVRKAFTLGIDRQTIIDELIGKDRGVKIPTGQWPNSQWEDTSLTPDPYDPEGAMALLDEAGYTDQDGDGIREGTCDGKPVKMSYDFFTTTAPLRKDVAVIAQSMLKEIGIEFKPNHVPGGTLFASYADGGTLSKGDFDIAGYTQGFYPDPYPQGGDWLCNVNSKNNPGGSNLYGICDEKLISLIQDINKSADPAVRKTAVDKVQEYMAQQYYVILLYSRIDVAGLRDGLEFGEFNSFSRAFWNTEQWAWKK